VKVSSQIESGWLPKLFPAILRSSYGVQADMRILLRGRESYAFDVALYWTTIAAKAAAQLGGQDYSELQSQPRGIGGLCTSPNLMFPVTRREVTPVPRAGCRGVKGLVPQPLFMKLRACLATSLECLSSITNQMLGTRNWLHATLMGRICRQGKLACWRCVQATDSASHRGSRGRWW